MTAFYSYSCLCQGEFYFYTRKVPMLLYSHHKFDTSVGRGLRSLQCGTHGIISVPVSWETGRVDAQDNKYILALGIHPQAHQLYITFHIETLHLISPNVRALTNHFVHEYIRIIYHSYFSLFYNLEFSQISSLCQFLLRAGQET